MQKMKRISKNENLGITLIALVITMIVLIILAGVSINFIFGKEGIFTKTQTAVETYQNAQNEEEIQIAKYSNEIDRYVEGGRDYKVKYYSNLE